MKYRCLLPACIAIIAASAGCRTLRLRLRAEPIPVKTYTADTLDSVRSVGFVPFTGRATGKRTTADVMEAFVTELQLLGRFHVIVARNADGSLAAPAGIRPEAPLTVDSLIHGRRESGLDAIITGEITGHRAYGSPMLGLSVKMISCKTGDVEWQASAVVDSSRAEVVARLRDYARYEQAGGGSRNEWRKLLSSPRRYAQFVSHEMLALLSEAGRNIVNEVPMDRPFSLVNATTDSQ